MEFGKRYPNGVEAAPGVAKSIIQGNYRAWLQSGILVNNEGRRLINEKASITIFLLCSEAKGRNALPRDGSGHMEWLP